MDESCGNQSGKRLCAGTHFVTLELQIKAATRQAQFTRRARNVSVVLAQSFGDHATLDFGKGVGERDVLQGYSY